MTPRSASTRTRTRRWASSPTSRTCRTSTSTRASSTRGSTGPELTTVVVAGDVAPEKVLPLVERHFGRWKRGGPPVEVPREPPPAGPVYAHVPWTTPTLPWVTVAFHGPAFSATKEWAAATLVFEHWFGPTSDLYRRLVVEEQIVDALGVETTPTVDPGLFTIAARLKRPEDALRVRDELLRTFARARAEAPDPQRLADDLAAARNGLVRSLDSTEAVADVDRAPRGVRALLRDGEPALPDARDGDVRRRPARRRAPG